ncbi:MAG: hypothetical protein WAK48_22420 [Candidatus Acidiferrum sp.]
MRTSASRRLSGVAGESGEVGVGWGQGLDLHKIDAAGDVGAEPVLEIGGKRESAVSGTMR